MENKLVYTTNKTEDYGITIKMLPNKVILYKEGLSKPVEYTLKQYGRGYREEALQCVETWKRYAKLRFAH